MGAITFIAKKMGCVANNGIYNTLLVVNWGLHNDLWLFDGFIDGSMGVSIVMGSTPKWVDGLWHGKPYENVSFRGAPHFRKPPDVDENKVMDNEHLGFSSQMDWPDSFFFADNVSMIYETCWCYPMNMGDKWAADIFRLNIYVCVWIVLGYWDMNGRYDET